MNYLKTIFFVLFSLLLSVNTISQNKESSFSSTPDNIVEKVVENGDTLFLVSLREVYVFPKFVFKNKKQEKFYWKTVRDVKKVLPYARIASVEINKINKALFLLPNDKERKRYIKKEQKRLFNSYEKKLVRLTVNQGRILMKLIDREQEMNTYELIKSYKGEFSAMFWNTIAHIFGSNLKANYGDSEKDKIVERVIILVENGQL